MQNNSLELRVKNLEERLEKLEEVSDEVILNLGGSMITKRKERISQIGKQ
jgi:hypothetical protein